MRKSTRWVPGAIALALLAAACSPDASQSSLEPAGPYADTVDDLFTPVFWVAVGVFVLVEGALLWFVIRYRHRRTRADVPPQIHGNTRLEIGWTILPAVILAGVAVPTVATIFDLAREPSGGNVMQIDVLGHQWWWEFDYPDLQINTANELHIPVNTPVYLSLCAAGSGYEAQPAPNECQADLPVPAGLGLSVIHSFWVPELAGKQDVVPGRTNTVWIEADRPGTYEGQCAEFCGLSHAYMRFHVVAHEADEFDAWVRGQQAEAASASGPAAQGQEVFAANCIQCHSVNGLTDDAGEPVIGAIQGPNLTHLMSRECFAGCIFETNTDNLTRWVSDAPSLKPGSLMPSGLNELGLTPRQVDAVVAYLETLE